MTYTSLTNLSGSDLKDLLQYPTISFSGFWEFILLALFFIIATSSYFAEVNRTGRGNLLSSLGVAGIILIVLSTLIRLLELISRDMLIINVVLGIVFLALWMFTDN